jgi:hypothetical protein
MIVCPVCNNSFSRNLNCISEIPINHNFTFIDYDNFYISFRIKGENNKKIIKAYHCIQITPNNADITFNGESYINIPRCKYTEAYNIYLKYKKLLIFT